MRRLLLLAALLPFLAACDSGTDEVSSVTITRAQVTSLSFDGSDSNDQWDDFYLTFRVGGTDVRASTRDDAERVRSADLVYEFDFGSDIEIVDLERTLVVQAYNRESSRANDQLIGVTVPVSVQSIADAMPGSQELESADSEFRVRLSFEYD